MANTEEQRETDVSFVPNPVFLFPQPRFAGELGSQVSQFILFMLDIQPPHKPWVFVASSFIYLGLLHFGIWSQFFKTQNVQFASILLNYILNSPANK